MRKVASSVVDFDIGGFCRRNFEDPMLKSIVGIKGSIFSEFATSRCMLRVDQRSSAQTLPTPLSTNWFHKIKVETTVPHLSFWNNNEGVVQVDAWLGNDRYIRSDLTILFIMIRCMQNGRSGGNWYCRIRIWAPTVSQISRIFVTNDRPHFNRTKLDATHVQGIPASRPHTTRRVPAHRRQTKIRQGR